MAKKKLTSTQPDQDRYPIERVVWLDAASVQGWASAGEIDQEASPKLCVSVGYVVKNNKDYISLAQTYSVEAGGIADVISIPASMIRDRRALLEGV